jgi:Carbohydrate phosphorylase
VKFVERKRLTRQESRLVGGAMLVDAAEEVILREGFEHASVDGLQYEYGIFRQSLQNGWQQEMPDNWLHSPDPWEVATLADPMGGGGSVANSCWIVVTQRTRP